MGLQRTWKTSDVLAGMTKPGTVRVKDIGQRRDGDCDNQVELTVVDHAGAQVMAICVSRMALESAVRSSPARGLGVSRVPVSIVE